MPRKSQKVANPSPDIFATLDSLEEAPPERAQPDSTGTRPKPAGAPPKSTGAQPKATGAQPKAGRTRPKAGRTRPKPTAVLLRIPGNLMQQLERALQKRAVKPNRHYWILEAIQEKASRELSRKH